TTRIRMGSPMGWSTFRSGDGDVERDSGSGLWGALDGECSVDLGGAFAHSLQAEVALRGKGGVGGVEAATIVGDGEGETVRVIAEVDVDFGGLCVAGGVGEGLLGDAEDFGFDGGGEGAVSASDVELRREVFGAGLF